MYSTETRIAMVEQRANLIRRKSEKKLTAMLCVICLIITVSIAEVVGASGRGAHGYVPGLYGSTLLSEDAGGYVLTGVLSFIVAVVITVLSIRHREKKKEVSEDYENE